VSLLDFDALTAERPDGTHLIDRIAARVADGSMPPIGMPRIPNADAEMLASWASCGELEAPPRTGLRSNRPPLVASEEAPAGLEMHEFRAMAHPIGPEVRDQYHCLSFEAELDAPRLVRRIEMALDDERVVHHLVLLRDVERRAPLGEFDCYDGSGMPSGSEYLFAWAPGQDSLEFPEGGLRVEPGERFLVQIHYNNGASLADVRDSSGVRLYMGPLGGPEYGMIAIGPTVFRLEPRARSEVRSRCTMAERTTLFAGMPHMHALGVSFSQDIVRANGARESLVDLDGWDFGTQLFYSLPVTLEAGDVVRTTCTFQNDRSEIALSGPDTSDEMCLDFIYVTPPPDNRYCDEGDEDQPTDVRYVTGECLPDDAPRTAPLVRGTWMRAAEQPPLAATDSIPEGRWELETVTFYVNNTMTPLGNIDLDRTYVLSRGQAITGRGELIYDVTSDNVVMSEDGVRYGTSRVSSFRATLPDAEGAVTVQCTRNPGPIVYELGAMDDRLTVGFETGSVVPGVTLWPRFVFRRVSSEDS
jgi:hypothetical protein